MTSRPTFINVSQCRKPVATSGRPGHLMGRGVTRKKEALCVVP